MGVVGAVGAVGVLVGTLVAGACVGLAVGGSSVHTLSEPRGDVPQTSAALPAHGCAHCCEAPSNVATASEAAR